jgi:ABC-type transport system involved in multi-copper enzyme maturation permease subunit
MDNIMTIFKKEFKTFFISPIAYIFIVVYLVVTNFLFFQSFFLINQADMRSYFGILPWIFLLFIPAITMRSWAEEKKLKTLELLLTWPISDFQVVAGKFLASFSFLAIAILLSISVPITISLLGSPDPDQLSAVTSEHTDGSCISGYRTLDLSITENQSWPLFLGGDYICLFIVAIHLSQWLPPPCCTGT